MSWHAKNLTDNILLCIRTTMCIILYQKLLKMIPKMPTRQNIQDQAGSIEIKEQILLQWPDPTQPKTDKLQQVGNRLVTVPGSHQANIRTPLHHLLRLDDSKSALSC